MVYLIAIPTRIRNILVGVLLSDGWMDTKGKGTARIWLKQSFKNSLYLFFVFFLLSHYCSSYPSITRTTIKGQIHCSLTLRTRN